MCTERYPPCEFITSHRRVHRLFIFSLASNNSLGEKGKEKKHNKPVRNIPPRDIRNGGVLRSAAGSGLRPHPGHLSINSDVSPTIGKFTYAETKIALCLILQHRESFMEYKQLRPHDKFGDSRREEAQKSAGLQSELSNQVLQLRTTMLFKNPGSRSRYPVRMT